MLKSYKYNLVNLDCANCAKKIENKIKEDNRFKEVQVNFNLLEISFKTSIKNPLKEINMIVRKIEPDVKVVESDNSSKQDKEIYRLIIAIILIILSFLISNKHVKEFIIILIYILLLYKTFRKALKKIIISKRIDENVLITISVFGAYFLGEHMEGIMVILLYVIGKILEEKAVNKSRGEIKNLLDLKINKAYLKRGKELIEVDTSLLKINDIVVVRKGDVIPTDGIIIKGNTRLDTSHLTGESILIKASVNSNVLSGSINKGDVIEVKVTNTYYESTAYQIFMLTMNATNNKSNLETKVSKIASLYTPIVLVIAVFIASILPLMSNVTYNDSIYRALTFLVISCPCAIAISVPLSYFAGIGAASKCKVLVKGSNFLDILSKCDSIVFDKTGTITCGSYKIKNINVYNQKYQKEEILKTIALGEKLSTHPLAKIILNEIDYNIDSSIVKNFQEIPGKGLKYELDDKEIKVGSKNFVHTNKNANIFLAINGEVVGSIVLDISIKDNAKDVIKKLKRLGLKTIMYTGDNLYTTKLVAQEINVLEYESDLLPDDKYQKLQSLKEKHKVIFVGDGINDTPSLALADVGISMGLVGSNSAILISDVVIMNDDLEGIIKVLNVSHKTNKIITMNLIFALGTKLIILILASFGLANMAFAVFADTGVTLIAILNTLRILKAK